MSLRSLKAALLNGALAAAASAVVQPAQAVVLAPSTLTPLPGSSEAADPFLAGVVLTDVVTPFSFTADGGTLSGTVQSRVVREDGTGTLDFYWRITSNDSSAGNIGSFRIGNFMTPSYDADYRTDSLGNTAPTDAYLFGGSAGDVNFNFTGANQRGLAPANSSYFIFLHTNATNYSTSAVYDLTNVGQTQISSLYATFAPVPEPQSIALMLVGLGAVSLLVRRRRLG
jgi:hypothetical protein